MKINTKTRKKSTWIKNKFTAHCKPASIFNVNLFCFLFISSAARTFSFSFFRIFFSSSRCTRLKVLELQLAYITQLPGKYAVQRKIIKHIALAWRWTSNSLNENCFKLQNFFKKKCLLVLNYQNSVSIQRFLNVFKKKIATAQVQKT